MCYLQGGPSHLDLWDPKDQVPDNVRSAFSNIKTNVPGMHMCELFPKLATMGDKCVLVRGLIGSVNEHSDSTAMTGYSRKSLEPVGGRPSNGAVISKVFASTKNVAPPFVSLMGRVTSGYLGPVHQPYVPDSTGRQNLQLDRIDATRLQNRR